MVQKRTVADHEGLFSVRLRRRRIREMFASWVLDGKTRATNSNSGGAIRVRWNKIQVPFVVVQNPGPLQPAPVWVRMTYLKTPGTAEGQEDG